MPKILIKAFVDVSAAVPNVAFSLLRMSVGRATFPSLHADYLKLVGEDVRLRFTSCIAVDVADSNWHT